MRLSRAKCSPPWRSGCPAARRHTACRTTCACCAALAGTRRFGGARLSGFVNRFDPAGEKQFAALTIRPEADLPYVAFRGTDGTLVGWKEDFNMAASTSVPSQREAAAYLNAAADALAGSLRAGGHSKGGNLAVYAAAFCHAPVQARVAAVYSHDGPGFLPQDRRKRRLSPHPRPRARLCPAIVRRRDAAASR